MSESIREINIATIEARTKYLVSERNFEATKFFLISISNRNETTHIITNKPVYLGLLIFKITETVMYEFWYN